MASTEHTLLFLLTAKIDSAFSSGFTTVQRELANMQKQIRDYNSTISNIQEYNRLTDSLASLSGKLAEARSKMDALKSGTDGAAGSEEKLAVEIERLNTLIANKQAEIDRMAAKLREAGLDTENLAEAEREAAQGVQELSAQQEQLAGMRNHISDIAQSFAVLSMMAGEALKPINAITEALEASVQTAAGFEYTMSAVEAVSGATANEAAALAAMAKELGATTVFTAQECAEAMQTQALAGWDVQDMLSGMPGVIKLAAAAGEDLASMTSIVSDALNAFGLSGEASVTKFADVLAKAATSANTNVALMGDSLSYVETTAGNLGYSIEDVSLALAAMANNALKGSVSGSALNTMLTRMSGANATAAKEMDALGLSMYDTVTGEAKPLLQFINELRDAFQGFGDNAREAQIAAYKLAGQRGMRGLLALVNSSDEEWEHLTEEVYNFAGAANSISDKRLANYTGQVTLLNSAIEGLKISTGEAMLPGLTGGAEILTGIVNDADELVQRWPDLITGGAAFAYTMKGALGIVEDIGPAMMGLYMILDRFKDSALTALIGGSIGLGAVALIAATAAAEISYVQRMTADTETLKNDSQDLRASIEEQKAAYQEAVSIYDEQRGVASSLAAGLDELLAKQLQMRAVEEQALENERQLMEHRYSFAGSLDAQSNSSSLLIGNLEQLAILESDLITRGKMGFAGGLMGVDSSAFSGLAGDEMRLANSQQEIIDTVRELNSLYPGLNLQYDAVTGTLNMTTQQIREFTGAMSEEERQLRKTNLENMRANLAALEKDLEDSRSKMEEFNAEHPNFDIMNTSSTAAAENYANLTYTLNTTQTAYDALLADVEAEEAALNAATQAKMDYLDMTNLTAEAFDNIEAKTNDLIAAYTEAYEAARTSFENQFAFYEELAQREEYAIQDLTNRTSASADAAEAYTANLDEIKSSGYDFSGMWDFLSSGSAEAIAWADSIADALSVENFTGIEDLLSEYERWSASMDTLTLTAGFGDAIAEELKAVRQAVSDSGAYDEALRAMQYTIQGYIDGLEDNGVGDALAADAESWIANAAAALGVASPSVITKAQGENVIEGYILGLESRQAEVMSLMSSIANQAVLTFGASLGYSTFYSYGVNAMQGAIAGIQSMQASLVAAAAAAGTAAANAYRAAQSINSPSKLFEWFSEMDMLGAIQGIERNQDEVSAVMAAAARENAAAYLSGGMASPIQDITAVDPYIMQAMSNATAEPVTPLRAVSVPSGGAGGARQFVYSPTIQASGGANAEEIRRILAEDKDSFFDQLDDYLDEREINQRRGVY